MSCRRLSEERGDEERTTQRTRDPGSIRAGRRENLRWEDDEGMQRAGATYSIPEQEVQTNEPIVMLT